jgi:hypothetical protein
MMYKIYGLVNPISGNIFYVGCTKDTLSNRLTAHLTKPHYVPPTGYVQERYMMYKEWAEYGLKPEIVLLADVLFVEVDMYEEYFYRYYNTHECPLIQAPFQFNYAKKTEKIKMNKVLRKNNSTHTQ